MFDRCKHCGMPHSQEVACNKITPDHEHEFHRVTGHCKICGLHAVEITTQALEKVKQPWQTPTREEKQCPRGGVCGYTPCSFCPTAGGGEVVTFDETVVATQQPNGSIHVTANLKADSGKVRMDLLPAGAVLALLDTDPDPKSIKAEKYLLEFMRRGTPDRNSLMFAFAAMAKECEYTLWEALSGAAEAFEHGAKKYAENDWLNGAKWSRYIAAALRHLRDIRNGDVMDKESKLEHSDHFLACILILLTYSLYQIGEDDRPKTVAVGNAKSA